MGVGRGREREEGASGRGREREEGASGRGRERGVYILSLRGMCEIRT